MAVQIQFDAHQAYQLEAVDAVVDLFDGQELIDQGAFVPGFEVTPGDALPAFAEMVFGNDLSLSGKVLRKNLRSVQDRVVSGNSVKGKGRVAVPEEKRTEFEEHEIPLDFSVEMETGTGKTYVYLRTIAELNRKYGFRKFVIVVPSVAIREGVVSSLDLVKDHFKEIYDGLQLDHYVYDSKAMTRVRQFATASHLQVMVINIDAFRSKDNLINRESDSMNGYKPIEFIQACRPVVIMDEPQNMESELSKDAIASLNPLFKVRYSATHRDARHMVYRLTPVDAYNLRLVKQIGVRGITQEHDLNLPHVEIKKITATAGSVTATATINKVSGNSTKATQVTLRKDENLVEVSGGREVYDGWVVEDIHAPTDGAPGYVEFGNGRILREGSSNGTGNDQLHRIQIRQAIESHFEREREFAHLAEIGAIHPTKPLTLFFIDKVAHYAPDDGKFRTWFEEEYEAVRKLRRNRRVSMPDVAEVHDGYFATNARGEAKDVQLDRETNMAKATKDVNEAFELIMRNKQRLLDIEEPLRFIFSHSALGEGWDNPNVFVICNLQDGKSLIRKRQQLGRGMRLPVMANGERCRDDEVNRLTVIANESFEEFASKLQKEIEEDTGEKFPGRHIENEADRVELEIKDGALEQKLFKELWRHVSRRTRYQLTFQTEDLVVNAVRRVTSMPTVERIKFTIRDGTLTMHSKDGVGESRARDIGTQSVEIDPKIPDILGELCRRTPVSRATLVRILNESGRLQDVRDNPTAFLDYTSEAINQALYEQLADNIVYSPIGEDRWEASDFVKRPTKAFRHTLIDVKKSITAQIPVDSEVERRFAHDLDVRDDVKLFVKLPSWFKINTPLGGYNPDWAIVREEDGGQYLYFVRETKGGTDLDKLRFENEKFKIKFGAAHFESIDVDYAFGDTADRLLGPAPSRQLQLDED